MLCSALSLDDDIRAIGTLINGFVRSISFGRDFEQQLSFYVEARSAFTNIDAVLVNLVQVRTLTTITDQFCSMNCVYLNHVHVRLNVLRSRVNMYLSISLFFCSVSTSLLWTLERLSTAVTVEKQLHLLG